VHCVVTYPVKFRRRSADPVEKAVLKLKRQKYMVDLHGFLEEI